MCCKQVQHQVAISPYSTVHTPTLSRDYVSPVKNHVSYSLYENKIKKTTKIGNRETESMSAKLFPAAGAARATTSWAQHKRRTEILF